MVSVTADQMIVEATVSAILDPLHSVISDRAVEVRRRDQKHHASIAERPTVRMVIVRVMTINVHEPILLVLHTFVSNPCSSHCFYWIWVQDQPARNPYSSSMNGAGMPSQSSSSSSTHNSYGGHYNQAASYPPPSTYPPAYQAYSHTSK